jgi:hypothetical protein
MAVEIPNGLADPAPTSPPRRQGSVRRTSHIDIAPAPLGALDLQGSARDLRTSSRSSEVIANATVFARVGPGRELVELQTSPADEGTSALIGLPVASGFRAAVDHALPNDREASTPLYLLLDELPVAVVISGYALLHRGDMDVPRIDVQHVKVDVCSGWRSEGTMMVALQNEGRLPVPVGPAAPILEPPDDPMAWHQIGPLAPGAMRRRRLLDVRLGDPLDVYSMFRDTHVDANGVETVLHEYSLTATLDPASLILSDCEARPRVLPWIECPAAAASASRLNGRRLSDVRRLVPREFRGTSICTHLNDLLRSLADLGRLASLLPAD